MVNVQLFESGWAAVIVACQTKFGESPSDARIEVLSRLQILERDFSGGRRDISDGSYYYDMPFVLC